MTSQRIHYGSLQETIKSTSHSDSIRGKTLEDLGISHKYHLLPETLNSVQISASQAQLLQEFEKKKQAARIYVPTGDSRVKEKLREFGEPVCLFGEGPAERRDRLREHLFERNMDVDVSSESEEEEEEEQLEEFYTVGSNELLESRKDIAMYSLWNARKRLEAQRTITTLPVLQKRKVLEGIYKNLKNFSTLSSQFGDSRPMSYCCFSHDSSQIATGSFGGSLKLWSVPQCTELKVLRGHKDRVCGIDFSPQGNGLVSSASDGRVYLWNPESQDTPIAEFKGHESRVPRVRYHPCGKYIATSGFDMTWRLWDVETQTELLLQEGHSKEVFALGFQPDGSLIATGGMDSIGRVWDLRSGKSITVLQGHVKSILSLDWSPNGYEIATGSEDHTIRIWDMRKPGVPRVVPAHNSIVTHVRYFQSRSGDEMNVDGGFDDRTITNGSFLVSCSYDATCKIFTEGDWKCIKVLAGLEGKIMSCDVSGDAKYICTAAYDRTWKLHSFEEFV